MTAFMVTLVCVSGMASQYAPGVAEQVIRTRHAMGQLAHVNTVDGNFLAVSDCTHLGERLWVRHAGKMEAFRVIDCAANDGTREWMRRNGILFEVDYQTARRWNGIGRGVPVEQCHSTVERGRY